MGSSRHARRSGREPGLNVMRSLPEAITALPATALAAALGAPTLFDLRKADRRPLFISVLLHGNEVSGWQAVRRLARELADASVLLFVGNVEAARLGARTTPDGHDFNRVWDGGNAPEAALARQVTDFAAAANPYLAVDVHNNTGDNPPYAVITNTAPPTLAAARAFAPQALLTAQPQGFQTQRFARFCTAITVEVGTPADAASADRAGAFLARLLREGALPHDGASPLRLFETIARVWLADGAVIEPAAQRFNFRPAPAGTALTRAGKLIAHDARGRDVSAVFLALENGVTVLKQRTPIAMYTGDAASARQDCLCYLLQRFDPPQHDA